MRGLVVSIGNSLMTDDGIGEAVLRELDGRGVDADLQDLGVDIFRLTSVYSGHNPVIIVDALRGGSDKPGTVMSFSGAELTEKLDSRIRSAHMLGSIEALRILMRLNDDLAGADIHMVGVVSESIAEGEFMTPSVRDAVGPAADLVVDLLSKAGMDRTGQ